MNTELDRVKQDIATISGAAGFGQPPLLQVDGWALAGIGAAGMGWAIASMAVGGFMPATVTTLGLLISFLAFIGHGVMFSRSRERTPSASRGFTSTIWLAAALGILIGGFYIWAKFYAGLDRMAVLGASTIMGGALFVVVAIVNRWNLSLAAFGLAFMVLGAAAPFLSYPAFTTAIGVAIACGGFAGAAVVHRQLKVSGVSSHGAH